MFKRGFIILSTPDLSPLRAACADMTIKAFKWQPPAVPCTQGKFQILGEIPSIFTTWQRRKKEKQEWLWKVPHDRLKAANDVLHCPHTHFSGQNTIAISLNTAHIISLNQRVFLMDVLPLSTRFLLELKVLQAFMWWQKVSVTFTLPGPTLTA